MCGGYIRLLWRHYILLLHGFANLSSRNCSNHNSIPNESRFFHRNFIYFLVLFNIFSLRCFFQKSVQNKIKLYIKLKQYNLPKHKLAFNLKSVHVCMCTNTKCMWPGYFIIYKITFLLCISLYICIYVYSLMYSLMMSCDNLQIELRPFCSSN